MKEGRQRIQGFDQGAKEPLNVAWERYKGLIYACPTHRILPYQQISIFYEGMNDRSRARVNSHSRNQFISMDPGEAWELMDELTTFDVQFGQRTDPDEEDEDIRELLQSLRACQICNSSDHGARECNAYQELN